MEFIHWKNIFLFEATGKELSLRLLTVSIHQWMDDTKKIMHRRIIAYSRHVSKQYFYPAWFFRGRNLE